MRTLRTAIVILLLTTPCHARGQSLCVAFYNVENLYDTIPSLFYHDGDYTPQGQRRWNTERYRNKLSNLAHVIDHLSPDLLGLAEVENEGAVRDLVTALSDGYNYIHHTGGDSRGMDLALLYRGDRFFPSASRLVPSGVSREFLHVSGELAGVPVEIVVCHLPSRLNNAHYRHRAMENLYKFTARLSEKGIPVIVMGDFNASPAERRMKRTMRLGESIRAPLTENARRGEGSYLYDGRWRMYDNILLCGPEDSGLLCTSAGVYIQSYLLDDRPGRRHGYPLRTFDGGTYCNGYSDHLPVYVILENTTGNATSSGGR